MTTFSFSTLITNLSIRSKAGPLSTQTHACTHTHILFLTTRTYFAFIDHFLKIWDSGHSSKKQNKHKNNMVATINWVSTCYSTNFINWEPETFNVGDFSKRRMECLDPWLPGPGGCLGWLSLWITTAQSSRILHPSWFQRGARSFHSPPQYFPNPRVSCSHVPNATLNWFTKGLSSTLQMCEAKMTANTPFFRRLLSFLFI